MDTLYLIILLGLAGPIIGSLIGVLKKPSENFMFNMLAFAAGVMLAISFLELIPSSIRLSQLWICSIGILAGVLAMYSLDKILPHIHPTLCRPESGSAFEKTSIFLMVGIFLHNFPEGMAMAAGTFNGAKDALIVALAIAIQSIPEGICTSAPYYYCTKKRLKSFLLSSSTAIPLILGFLLTRFFLQGMPPMITGFIIAATAGVMVYISADELIPVSCCKHGDSSSHSTIFSLIFGILLVILLGAI
jgi:zinc transporter, ZIP family